MAIRFRILLQFYNKESGMNLFTKVSGTTVKRFTTELHISKQQPLKAYTRLMIIRKYLRNQFKILIEHRSSSLQKKIRGYFGKSTLFNVIITKY